jgi:hypothetical protein
MSTEQQSDDLFERLRSKKNKQILIDNYRATLNNGKANAIDKRYAADMLIALTDESQKAEINAYWNEMAIRSDIESNKIEFLHETIEHLRELVIQAADPETSMGGRHSIVRDVRDKNFINNVRGRIAKRIRQEEKRVQDEIDRKDALYREMIKESEKRYS